MHPNPNFNKATDEYRSAVKAAVEALVADTEAALNADDRRAALDAASSKYRSALEAAAAALQASRRDTFTAMQNEQMAKLETAAKAAAERANSASPGKEKAVDR